MKLPYRFGRYTLVEKIASGGMAEVYRAVLSGDQGFAKTVAVKRLKPAWGGSEEMKQMLIDEARALVHLQHQTIVQVFELDCFENVPFLAMEYVDGIDCARLLNDIVRDGERVSINHAIYIMSNVLVALEFAHRSTDSNGARLNIVHRDVSPSNILFSWNGEVKVTDFGIAKGMHRTHETEAGQLRGKFSYMAPEQARGQAIDSRADIFACGIILYELLTARRLFDAATDAAVLEKIRETVIPDEAVRGLAPEIRAVLMTALAPDPARRFQNASEMLSALHSYACISGEVGSSLEFAEFLRERFPVLIEERLKKSPAPILKDEAGTKIMDARRQDPKKIRPLKILRAAGIAAMLIGMALVSPRNNSEVKAATGVVHDKAPVEAVKIRHGGPPLATGSVAIDTRPKGASGKIIIGDKVRDVVTPFSIDGIDLAQEQRGSVELALAGYAVLSIPFELTEQSPAFVKTVELKKIETAAISVHARPWGVVDIAGYVSGRETPVKGIKLKAGSYLLRVSHPPTGKIATTRVELSGGDSKHCVAMFGDKSGITCK